MTCFSSSTSISKDTIKIGSLSRDSVLLLDSSKGSHLPRAACRSVQGSKPSCAVKQEDNKIRES